METQPFIAPNGVRRLTWDQAWFPWRYAVCAAMGNHAPEALHEFGQLQRGADHHQRLQSSPWHRAFYARFLELVQPVYLDFVRWLALTHNAEHVVYQAVPTLRIQFPGDLAVGEWHRDADYGHRPGEVNFWLPITEARQTSALWIAGKPHDCTVGDLLIFDGVNLMHGNKPNATGKTRVSLDFRLCRREDFRPSGADSVTAGRRFEIGPAYFEVLP